MSYNGWKNYETWNVFTWLTDDRPLYWEACRFVEQYDYLDENLYFGFIMHLGLESEATPDGARWLDENLDYDRLDEAMRELTN